jgi:hypothetical protein
LSQASKWAWGRAFVGRSQEERTRRFRITTGGVTASQREGIGEGKDPLKTEATEHFLFYFLG